MLNDERLGLGRGAVSYESAQRRVVATQSRDGHRTHARTPHEAKGVRGQERVGERRHDPGVANHELMRGGVLEVGGRPWGRR